MLPSARAAIFICECTAQDCGGSRNQSHAPVTSESEAVYIVALVKSLGKWDGPTALLGGGSPIVLAFKKKLGMDCLPSCPSS